MGLQFPIEREAKRAMLLAAVTGIRDTIRQHADAAETGGTLPQPIVEALVASGLLRLKLPAVLGGAEADPATQIEVIEALAAIEPSVAWCAMVGATGLALPGAFLADAAVAEIFGDGHSPTGAVVAMAAGRAVPVEGGYRLTGRWPFASGVRHARWITLGATVERGGGAPPEVRFLVLPVANITIHDNWDVAGLEATGSCDVSVADRFVPAAFTWDRMRDAAKRGGPLYRLPNPGFVANEHAAFALGVGRAALDEIATFARSKQHGFTPAASSLEARAAFQRFVGESDLRLRAARALLQEVYANAWTALMAGGEASSAQHGAMRAAATYATEVAADIVTRAFRFAGGAAAYRSQRLQRLLRDINVGAQHLMVADIAYENHGQFLLGLPDADPMR